MQHELQVVADPDAVAAGTAAAFVARLARTCVQAHGRFTFAVSGGHTPWAMFAALSCARPRPASALVHHRSGQARTALEARCGRPVDSAGRVEAAAWLRPRGHGGRPGPGSRRRPAASMTMTPDPHDARP